MRLTYHFFTEQQYLDALIVDAQRWERGYVITPAYGVEQA